MAAAPPLDDIAYPQLAGVQKRLLGAHFLLLARLLRKSARVDFEDHEPQNLLERRIVLWLFRIEHSRVSELAGLLGNDVAQVSRALTSMRSSGLVERGRQRDPYQLTALGRQLGEVQDVVSLRREEQLTAGLDPRQMFELAGLLINLLHQANAILHEELSKLRATTCDEAKSVPLPAPPSIEIHARAQPLITNIATTVARGATASFKRLTGISNYEWRILANIAERPAIRFTEVVQHVDSDKAQVSRTLDALVGAQLLERRRSARGEPVRFTMTARGEHLYSIMREDALRRNDLLESRMTANQRSRLQTYIELLLVNAEAMSEATSEAAG